MRTCVSAQLRVIYIYLTIAQSLLSAKAKESSTMTNLPHVDSSAASFAVQFDSGL